MELEQKVDQERQRYHQLTLQDGAASAVVPRFTIQDQYKLNKDLACYTLMIELVVPIDYILLQVSSIHYKIPFSFTADTQISLFLWEG